jgi:hypothetical protein
MVDILYLHVAIAAEKKQKSEGVQRCGSGPTKVYPMSWIRDGPSAYFSLESLMQRILNRRWSRHVESSLFQPFSQINGWIFDTFCIRSIEDLPDKRWRVVIIRKGASFCLTYPFLLVPLFLLQVVICHSWYYFVEAGGYLVIDFHMLIWLPTLKEARANHLALASPPYQITSMDRSHQYSHAIKSSYPFSIPNPVHFK